MQAGSEFDCFCSWIRVWGIIVSVHKFISSYIVRGVWSVPSVFRIVSVEVCQGDKTIILFLIYRKHSSKNWCCSVILLYNHMAKRHFFFLILLHDTLGQQENAMFIMSIWMQFGALSLAFLSDAAKTDSVFDK